MYKDIGFYITDVDENSHNNILDTINDFIENNPYKNVVVFNNVFNKINTNNKYYLLHLNEAKYFNGILFIFNPTDASLCSTFPGPSHKIFYTSEIYWQNNPYIPYVSWKNIFLKDITTIVSSQEHYNIYSMCWKQPLLIDEKFTKETINNVIKSI
jgi:hypothetical protein